MRRMYLGILLVSTVGLAVLLSACGGGLSTPNLPSKPLSKAAATQMSSTAVMGNDFVASMIAPGGFSPMGIVQQGLKAAGLQPAQSSACNITDTPTNPVDNDGDGWYASAKEVINCDLGGGNSITGTITETDKNDNDPYSGVKATIKDFKITSTDSSGNTSTLTENMTWDLTKGAGKYSLSYDFSIAINDPTNGNALFEVKGTPTYTPDAGVSNPFDAGTFTLDGSVTYQDSSSSYKLTDKSSGVHYSSSCAGFDSGTIDYADNQGDTASITYTGCDTISLTYNGSTVY